MWISRAGCEGLDVASHACSKLKDSGVEFGPKMCLSHFWVRGGTIFCPVCCREALVLTQLVLSPCRSGQ